MKLLRIVCDLKQTRNRLARVRADGKPAHTIFERIARSGRWSLIRCRPVTGRQNQIRAHLAAAGYPILGDTGYGSDAERWRREVTDQGGPLFPGRALLHSVRLRFPHPIWNLPQCVQAPPPADFSPYNPTPTEAGTA